jgi:hypothetical protein
MSIDTSATVIATIIATIMASVINLLVNYFLQRKTEKTELDRELHQIIKYSFDYPYLESKAFISKWNTMKDKEDDKYLRYEIYCNLLFNYLERLSRYYKYNRKDISSALNIQDWVRTHRDAWESPADKFENIDSYNSKFKEFMKSLLS